MEAHIPMTFWNVNDASCFRPFSDNHKTLLKQAQKTERDIEEHSTDGCNLWSTVKTAASQRRKKVQYCQTMQPHAMLIHQQALVTEATARAQTAEEDRADMARTAARPAARVEDGDIIDNEALGQPFNYTGKKHMSFQCGTPKLGSSWEPVSDWKSLRP